MPAKSTFGSASVIPYSSSSSSYKISRSLRFNSGDLANLTRTPSSAGNRKTFTISFWAKRSSLSSNFHFIQAGPDTNTITSFSIGENGSSPDNINLTFFDYQSGSYTTRLISTQVFRDPSAWIHFVASIDTTQSTASSRVRLYANGSQITSFSTSTYPSQNQDLVCNNNVAHRIGSYVTTRYSDGYITEYNFIDGQALDPSSFGYTDSTTGSWMSKKYVGTYGTNGFYLPFQNQSSTQNLFTYSEDFSNVFWTKYLCSCTTDATTAPNGTNTADKQVINNGQPYGQFITNFSATDNTIYTSSVYVKALDFTTGRLYIQKKDGVFSYIIFDLTTGSITAQVSGATGTITSVGNGWYRVTCTVNVGTGASTTPSVHFEFTGTGDGVKGSYIWGAQFEISSSAGPYMYTLASTQAQTLALGEDRSLPTGGYNNWAASAFSVTTGSGNDSLLDSPTDYGNDTGLGGEVGSNYATFNSVDLGGSTLTNGNLDISSGANQYRYSTMPVPQTGKWYFEFTVNSLGATNTGFWIVLPTLGGVFGLPVSGAYRILKDASDISITGSGTPAAGHTMKVAYDADNKRIWFGRDTLWFSNAGNTISDPSAGTNPSFSNLTSTNNDSIYVNQTGGGAATCTGSINFGQRPFAYAAPTGFKTLCTANMPTPTIKKPKSVFDAITYNGTGTTFVSPSGLAFAPDLVWVKSRSGVANHGLHDTVRVISGDEAILYSNTTDAESIGGSYLSSFDSNGFTLNNNSSGNGNGSTYVAWNWKASSTSSTNTDGSITSTVRANPQAGFSVVSYTGNGSAATIGHGLGATPKMIIAKTRSTTGDWVVGHASLDSSSPWGYYIFLNSTAARNSVGAINSWGNNTVVVPPTSTVFSVGNGANLNSNEITYIAYCFAEIEGYSKFGSYTGNGSSDGPFVWCGFRPRWVMIKEVAGTNATSAYWITLDTSRDTSNVSIYKVAPNSSDAENSSNIGTSSQNLIDINSNGIKLRSTNFNSNESSGTYIFAAFAESPFKYARAR